MIYVSDNGLTISKTKSHLVSSSKLSLHPLHLFGHSAFVTHDGAQARQGDA